jgi:hypothetical protein
LQETPARAAVATVRRDLRMVAAFTLWQKKEKKEKKKRKEKKLRDLRMVGGAAFAFALGLPLIYPVKKKRVAYVFICIFIQVE